MRFEDLPIRRKLIRIVVLTTVTGLGLAGLVLLGLEYRGARQTLVRNLTAIARVIAESSSGVLLFDDLETGNEILGGLRAEPEIVAAALYDREGRLFAHYPRPAPLGDFPGSPGPDGAQFAGGRLHLFVPVTQGPRRAGTLFVSQDLEGMHQRLGAQGLVLLAVLGGAGLVALFFSRMLQRSISAPILHLVNAARRVTEDRDYSVRAPVSGQDELGFLTAGFNLMLDQIQATHAALQESEQRFRTAADSAPVLLWMGGKDKLRTWFNKPWLDFVGRPLEQEQGNGWLDHVHPDDRQRCLRTYHTAFDARHEFRMEYRLQRHDGEFRWLLVHGVPRYQGSEFLGYSGSCVDITDRRLAEAALHAGEQQLRLVTDNAQVFIVQADRNYRYRFINRPYADRFGRSPDAIVGRTIAEVVGDAAFATFRPHVDAALSGQRVEFEMEIPYATLGPRWVHVIYEPERAPDGQVIGLVGVSTDITGRKKVEQEVVLARDQALAASRAKDNFLATLSHELRTPLNPALLLASERAADSDLPARVQADFATIRNCVELEAQLIDDLLDLTRISHGKVSLAMQSVDAHTLLRDALATVEAELIPKRLQLRLELNATPPFVRGDPVRIKQVCWNVLQNAVKFTPEGGSILVKTWTSESPNTFCLEVTDTGIGMTPTELARLFRVFSQGDHAEGGGSHRFGGLGLGMAISRMLVEMHDGRIRAESPGRGLGVTIRIDLPLGAVPATADDVAESRSNGATRGPALPGAMRRRILLVEDHEPTRLALAGLLARRNYEVVVAASVAQATSLTVSGGVDLVISDLGLPDGSGLNLMSELRARHGLKGIALTGYGMEHDVLGSQAAGFIAHLTKPVRVQALEDALEIAFSRVVTGPSP